MKIKMKIKVPRIPVMIKVSGAIKPVSFDVRNSCHTGGLINAAHILNKILALSINAGTSPYLH